MSFETPQNNNETIDRSTQAMEAAAELIAENEVLKNNPRVQTLMENEFVTEDGRELDPGNFLSAMLDFIETQGAESVSPEEMNTAIEKYTVDANLHVEVLRNDSGIAEKTE